MDAVAVLEIEKVDYAVIGAMAASVHGVVRASLDADAVMSLTVQEAPALEKNFRAAGFSRDSESWRSGGSNSSCAERSGQFPKPCGPIGRIARVACIGVSASVAAVLKIKSLDLAQCVTTDARGHGETYHASHRRIEHPLRNLERPCCTGRFETTIENRAAYSPGRSTEPQCLTLPRMPGITDLLGVGAMCVSLLSCINEERSHNSLGRVPPSRSSRSTKTAESVCSKLCA